MESYVGFSNENKSPGTPSKLAQSIPSSIFNTIDELNLSNDLKSDVKIQENSLKIVDKSLKGLVIVIKIGSSSLSSADGKYPNLTNICKLVETICELKKQGHKVVLVSSGAVAIGCQRMGLSSKPKNIVMKQAIAAVGQGRLMRMYDDFFSALDQPIAQVLLTRENLSASHHYDNASNTFSQLLEIGVIPIVNENDTVSVEELRVGDNDTLSALVASLVQADYLFLLTDVDALYTADPSTDKNATPIHIVEKMESLQVQVGNSGSWGTGGMATKLHAARIGTMAGVRTVIMKSTEPKNIFRILAGDVTFGTQFVALERPIKGKKKWLAHYARTMGNIYLDLGASSAISKHSSLFAAGITKIEGKFEAQSVIAIANNVGKEIARGIANYSSDELDKIKGKSSSEFESLLGYIGSDETVSRFNLVLL